MESVNLKKYINAVKSSIPDEMRVDKESIKLISLIINDINDNLVRVISSKTRGVAYLSAEDVRDSIKSVIPADLRKYAFAQASKEVALFNSGLIDYKVPKPPKIGVLEKRMFKKGLEEVAAASLKQCALSKDCTVLSGLMQKIAVRLAERSTEAIQRNAEHSLNNMRDVLKKELGPDLFVHSQGHADQNLGWYYSDKLDFSLKLLFEEKYKKIEDSDVFVSGVQKRARSDFDALIEKDSSEFINKTLSGVLSKLLEKSDQQTDPGVSDSSTISENTISQAVSNLLPRALLRHAVANAESDVMKYALGDLVYKYKKPPQQDFMLRTDEWTEADETPTVNYRPGIKRLMLMFEDCTAGKGYLLAMNEMLNDICCGFADKCSEAAQDKSGLLTEEDVLHSMSALFPEDLKRHALARIAQLQKHSILRSAARRVQRLPRPSIAFESRRSSLILGSSSERVKSDRSGSSIGRDVSPEVQDVAFTGASRAPPFTVNNENVFSAMTGAGRQGWNEQPRATEMKEDCPMMKVTGMEPWRLKEFEDMNAVAFDPEQGPEKRTSREELEADRKMKQDETEKERK